MVVCAHLFSKPARRPLLRSMNFLAHLHLVYDDEDLMLGALLGDFVRGRRALWSWPVNVRKGIKLHRRIDKLTDQAPEFRRLQKHY